jgi:hypothetical protein
MKSFKGEGSGPALFLSCPTGTAYRYSFGRPLIN